MLILSSIARRIVSKPACRCKGFKAITALRGKENRYVEQFHFRVRGRPDGDAYWRKNRKLDGVSDVHYNQEATRYNEFTHDSELESYFPILEKEVQRRRLATLVFHMEEFAVEVNPWYEWLRDSRDSWGILHPRWCVEIPRN